MSKQYEQALREENARVRAKLVEGVHKELQVLIADGNSLTDALDIVADILDITKTSLLDELARPPSTNHPE